MAGLQKLGKYEIKAQVGRGAMGVVYKGVDPVIERTVALKNIRRDILDEDKAEEMLARFKREAQAAGQLNHPNIVTVYEYGEDTDTVYIAMEYVEGRDLREILNRGERFSIGTTINIMRQLLEALAYSHRQGVVHRDIKPANVILLADGTIKITDFGIAHLETSNLTQYGEVLGTPSYMSPEQCIGDAVDSRTDLFSAGIIMYQLLTAEKPFPGEAMTTIMHRVVNVEPPAPSELNLKIPSALNKCVTRALFKNPADRFQTAEEFLEAVKSVDPGEFAVPAIGQAIGNEASAGSDQETVALDSDSFHQGLTFKNKARQQENTGIFSFLHNKAAVIGIGLAFIVALALTVKIFVSGPELPAPPLAENTLPVIEPQKQKIAKQRPQKPAKQQRSTIRLTGSSGQADEQAASPTPKPVTGIRPRVRD